MRASLARVGVEAPVLRVEDPRPKVRQVHLRYVLQVRRYRSCSGYSTLEEYISGATFTTSAPVIASMPVDRR